MSESVRPTESDLTAGAAVVTPGDTEYERLASRPANRRFPLRPDRFVLARSAEHVAGAVQAAVREGHRVAPTSGGHCYEGFVSDPEVRTVIDVSRMDTVRHDPGFDAIEVGAGARLLDTHRALYERWGVALPGGVSATVAFGGHVPGGGYGALTRRHGVITDHLHAVEVVVVDGSGRARTVVATREPDDPHRDLWWGHTGAGGGALGIATRYWFRTPGGATRKDTDRLLPTPPHAVLGSTVIWPRGSLDRDVFHRLVQAHGRWHERNSGPDSVYTHLFSGLVLLGRTTDDPDAPGAIAFTHMDAGVPGADRLLEDYIAELREGSEHRSFVIPADRLSWTDALGVLAAAQDAEAGRQKIKSAFLRKGFTEAQTDTLYDYLWNVPVEAEGVSVSLQSFGGRANAVPPGETAMPHRDSVLMAIFMNTWQDPALDASNLSWLRRLYRDVHSETGGVPVPGERADGCFVNFPDVDMADPRWNASSVHWNRLYHGDLHDRLQAVKARWDPHEVFRHRLSVRPPH